MGKTFLSTPMTDAEREFINFISEHQRSYGTKEEYEYRLSLFADAYNRVKNQDTKASFKLGLNHLADMSDYEYKRLLGYKAELKQNKGMKSFAIYQSASAPASVDWRANNAVTGVKNQGSCGSCWAFSTTGSVEGAHAIASGNLVSISEQQLVDCAYLSYGNMGCSGGLMDNAFTYLESNNIETESAYPYEGVRGTCQYSTTKGQFGVKSFVDVVANSPDQLLAAAAIGPVSVAIEADKAVFQLYKSGVMNDTKCGTSLDHGVLLVGYGSENGQDYWIVKNSWGVTWGEQGYIRLGRDNASGPGICGIQMQASYPVV
jgi:C1A family cysteine protease